MWQHERIRALLDRARSIARSALAGGAPSPDDLVVAIDDIRSVMEAHCGYEERHWLPLLRDNVPLGPQWADDILVEHRTQRELMADLHREACAAPGSPTLPARLEFLVAWLRSHMAEEERYLMLPDLIHDDFLVIEQSAG
jgi:hypothetical protein